MIHWINIPFVLILVQTLVLVEAAFITSVCVHNTDINRSVQLNCFAGYISNVSVVSGTGSCAKKESGKCLGMAPTLMVEYMNCYWRHECKINWPHDPIIFTESVLKDCIGRHPTFMAISYNCFNPTDFQEDNGYSGTSETGVEPKTLLIDACSNITKTQSCYKRSGLANTGGIIRSHSMYPWDYSNKPRNCTVKLYWPKGQQLIVTVKNVDLSDGDSLSIVYKHKTVNASPDKTFKFSDSDGFETSFLFNVGMESNSGKGFLLCFKFVSGNDLRVHDACNEIMVIGNVKAVQDGKNPLFPHLHNSLLTELALPAPKPEQSTPRPTTTTEAIPKCCKNKKKGKRREKCIKRQKKKKKKCRKKRSEINKSKGKRSKKNERRRRRHTIWKHVRSRGW